LVIAFNTSTEEHCVHFHGASSGEWLNLGASGRVAWQAAGDPKARPRLAWVASGGTWAGLLHGEGSRDLYERLCGSKAPTASLPLGPMLDALAASLPRPFELPDCVLEILDESCPKIQPGLPTLAVGEEDLASRPLEVRGGTCARSRPWSKEAPKKAKQSAHAGRSVAAHDASQANGPTAARQREGRREARVDGRLEQGGFGKKRLRFARSGIEGWGVFTDESLAPGDGVLEYRGVVVGNCVADARERLYRAQRRDDYQFRIDACTVVDATLKGSLARYVNHSCDPNCFTQIVEYGAKKKIVIYARKRIEAGEELTYDYKFAIEEDAAKLPCACGAVRCKGWMN
jgi:hypothetical protein